MATDGGKYEDLCTYVRTRAQAKGAIVLVFDGCRGLGFSVQATAEALSRLPGILHHMADQMEADLTRIAYPEPEITCGGCGRSLEAAEVRVLPGVPRQGIPAEVRCSRCIGEEAPRG